jgi:hypothetical protein
MRKSPETENIKSLGMSLNFWNGNWCLEIAKV